MANPNLFRVQNSDGSFSELTQDKLNIQDLPKAGNLRSIGDTLLKFGRGAVGATKALTDVAGANNVVSNGLDAVGDFISSGLSDEAKVNDQIASERLKASQDSGTLEQLKAVGQNFLDNPIDTLAEGAGSIVPTAAAMLASKGKINPANAGVGMGVAQGAGAVKGSIYDQTKQEALDNGLSPDEAEKLATDAQSYSGKNADQIALGAGLGYIAGKTGAETSSVLTGQAKQGSGLLRDTLKGFATEGLTEGAQGGQEKLAANMAVRREGSSTPLYSGVAGQAGTEAIAGGLTGGAFGLADSMMESNPRAQLRDTLLAQNPNGALTQAAATAIETGASDQVLGLPNYVGEPLVTFPDGTTMTRAEAEQRFSAEELAAFEARTGQNQQKPISGLLQQKDLDPYIVFADGSTGKREEFISLINSLPESERIPTMARLLGYSPQKVGANVSDTNKQPVTEMATEITGTEFNNIQGSTGNSLSEPTTGGVGNVTDALGQGGASDIQRGTDGTGVGGEALGDIVESGGVKFRKTANGYERVADEQSTDALQLPAEQPSNPRQLVGNTDNVQNTLNDANSSSTLTQNNDISANDAATSNSNTTPQPTQAQKDAGNYKLGRVKVNGLDISVENPDGSTRSGVDRYGKSWESTMKGHYGYVKGVKARSPDKEHVDVNVKPGTSDTFDGDVFVINQNEPTTGKFDEPKVYIGYANEAEAEAAYRSNYAKDWQGLGDIVRVPMSKFKAMLDDEKAFLKPVNLTTQAPKVSNQAKPKSITDEEVEGLFGLPAKREKALKRIAEGRGWFGGEAKAKEFVRINGLSETHEAVKGKGLRWDIVEKKADNAETDTISEIAQDANAEAEKFNVVAVNDKTGKKTLMTATPVTEREGNTIISKNTVREGRTLQLDAVSDSVKTNGPHFAAGVSAFKEGKPRALPSYFTTSSGKNPNDWLKGWDSAKNEAENNQTDIPKAMADAVSVDNLSNEQLDQVAGILGIEADKPKQFANNKVFTADAVEKARARLNSKLGNINSGIDPELLIDGMTIAGAYIESGVRSFAAYSKAMVADFGEGIKPYLLSFYEAARAYPGIDKEGMTSVADAQKEYDALITPATEKTNLAELKEMREKLSETLQSQGTVTDARLEERLKQVNNAISDIENNTTEAQDYVKNDATPTKEVNENARTTETKPVPAGTPQSDLFSEQSGRGDSEPMVSGVARESGNADTNQPVRGSVQEPSGNRAQSTGANDRDGSPSTAREDGNAGNQPSATNDGVTNFEITDNTELGQGSAGEKYRNNVAAIKIIKTLEAENRQATPEEREALAKYAGFGALSGVFDRNNAKFSKEYAELKALLTPEEYDAARASIRNAYFTSPAIVKSMYDGIAQLGFKGGRVLEPSMGSGNFFGMMPAGMRNKSDLNGVELDVITSRLAKHLYPNANIATATGFQDYNAPNDYFDLVISNPPFGDEKLTDTDKTAYSGFSIHNYFIAKSIDKLREGGVMAVVVSHSFMDANNTKAREWIAQRSNLIGAVRLPKEAFKDIAGTEVITDILYFQKTASPEANPSWIKATDNGKYSFNDYFIANPRNVLGRVTDTTNQFGITYTVETVQGTLQQNLKEFNSRLPQSIYVAPTKRSDILDSADSTVPDGVKVGTYYLDANGVVRQRLTDIMNNKRSMVVEMPNEGSKKRILGMMELRDTLRNQMRLERSADATQSEIEANRKELNKQYDQFVKDFGYLNSMTNRRLFLDDTESALLQALELDYDQGVSALKAKSTGMEEKPASATKADIFKQRVLFPPSDMVTVSNAKDALLASLNATGGVDIDYMMEAYNKSENEIVSELGDVIYKDPVNGYVTADEYLSGDVKTKLAEAIYAAKSEPAFNKNVEALEKVIPKDKLPSEIFASPGANWIPHKVYEEFASEITGMPAESMRFNYLSATATWLHERGTGGDAGKMTSDYGTDKINSYDLFVMLLNGKTPEIKYTVRNPDGTTSTNTDIEATEEARSKYQKIKELWDSWLYSDANRADELATIYNEKHNRIVPRKYDGSHMTFAGMTPVMNGKAFAGLRPHQKDVVWRGIQDRNVLLDHVVGAGKTMAMAATAMEMKRLGIARKPLFVVPNHLTLQWRSEFTKLYPASNILAATPDDFAKDKRERMFSKMVTGNYDAIIIGHSSLKKIGLPADIEERMYNEQVKEIADAIEQMKIERGDRSIVRDMEKIKTNLETKIKDLKAKAGEKDNVVSFDELGVDALFVDEMHEFKNLFFTTQMQRTSGLGNPKGSGKALDLFMKIKWLTETLGEKAPLITATGTPVSNSLAEMFTMQRYMKFNQMKRDDLHLFDAWSKQYGEVENVYEVAPSGVGYRQSTRFSKFKNLPSLMAHYRTFADVITLQDLKDQTAQQLDADGNPKKFPVPKLKTGKPINVIAKRSELQSNFFGVPKLATDADGNILFEINPETASIEKNKDDKFVLRHSKGQSTHDTQEDAELELAAKSLAPQTYLDPESLLGKFANLKELTKKTNGKVNALSLTGLANKAGLDYRLIDPNAPDFADSKINQAVTNMVQEYKNNSKDKGTQLVFCDMSIPNSARASMASKEKRVYVRDGKYLVTHKSKGTIYSPEGYEGYPFYLVKETAGIVVYEAVSGVNIMAPNFADRTEAKAWINQYVQTEVNRDKVFALRDQYAIESAEIDEYRDEKELEVAEDGSNEISLEDLEAIAGSSKFSVYDDIKAKLMAQGVPESEIAFIHDYNTPKRKEMLFKQVNRGEVRFLLGSTPKLGAGTNVQERLVALHHIDAPWRPSDLEQREGRIIRQGNKLYERDPEGFEVGIYRYATEQTYDTRRWQLLEHKASGIEQLRKYSGEAEIEDVTSEAANSADMKAAASGNPLILEETKLRTEVKRLNSLLKAHGDSKFSMARKIKSNEIAITDRFPKSIAMFEELIANAKSNPIPSDKEAIANINVDGLKTTNKAKAEDAIGGVATKIRQSYLISDSKKITYRGIEFTLERGTYQGELKLFAPDGQLAYYKVTDSFSPSGFITRLNNYIDSLDAKIESVKSYIAQAKKENDSLKSRVDEPFEYDALLKQTQAKHADVQRKLMKSSQLEAIPKEQVGEFKRVLQERKDKLKELGYDKALGEYESDNDTVFSHAQSAPTFYSQLTRAISESKNNRAPAGIWKAFIKNLTQKGVKQDEIEWTGINEWLDLQTGTVTKEQVLQYLDANGVLKKVGGGKVELSSIGKESKVVKRGSTYYAFVENEQVPFSSESDAVDYVTRFGDEAPKEARAITITPEMREKIMGGLPLFRAQSLDEINAMEQSYTPLLIDDIKATIKNDIYGHEVDVYAEWTDAPVYIQDQIIRERAFGVEGFFDSKTNRVALIASNLSSLERAKEVARHELIGHYGIENMMNEIEQGSFNRVLNNVLIAYKSGKNEAINDVASYVLKSQPALKVQKSDTDATKSVKEKRLAKEIIAVMAERNVQNGIVKRVIDAVRKFLKKIGFIKSDVTDAEIATLLREAKTYLAEKSKNKTVEQMGLSFANTFLAIRDRALTEGEMAISFSKENATLSSGDSKSVTVGGIEYKKIPFEKTGNQIRGAIEAYKDGKLVGDLNLYKEGDKYELSTIYVMQNFRRQGIATEMLKQAQDYVGGNKIFTKMITPHGRKFFGSMGIKRGDVPDIRNKNTILVDGSNDSILFSVRSPQQVVSDLVQKSAMRDDILGKAMTVLSEPSSREFGALKNIRTQLDKARQDPKGFGRMFDAVSRFTNDARLTAARPAELAPSILGSLEQTTDSVKEALNQIVKGDRTQADKQAVAKFLFEGTLAGGADVMAGKRYTPEELRAKGATDAQVSMYFEARNAVDASLDETTSAIAYNMVRKYLPTIKDDISNNPSQARYVIRDELVRKYESMLNKWREMMAEGSANESVMKEQRKEARELNGVINNIKIIFEHLDNLKAAGYMPLSRFGKYSVTAYDESGEVAEFYRVETETEAKLKEKELHKTYANVVRGVMPTSPNTLFAGVDPDTVALFLDNMGNIEGINIKDEVFQEWYRNAVSDRSALKRMIERKGIEGYSEDLERVLANFITSNSRFAAQNYNRADMLDVLNFLRSDPEYKRKGDVFDEAKELYDYVNNPEEPFQFGRSVMFGWFMGGSLASAAVNMTQPLTMTLPWLSQYAGVGKIGRAMKQASKLASAITINGKKAEGELGKALERAREIGLVDPQETHNLFKAGAGGFINTMSASRDIKVRMAGVTTLWGLMFGKAEQFNRHLTFITAYNLAANDTKLGDPFKFAQRAVEETQGIYGKNNRPNWARGTGSFGGIGAMAFTFKQYSIAYIEMITRMAKSGPQGKKAALMALGILFLLSGGMGLPFSDDELDVLDTALQMSGGEGNTRRHLRNMAIDALGEDLGMLALYGVSTYMPFDIQGRMGMGNLLPATALFMPSNSENRARSAMEILGASGSLLSDGLDAIQGMENGKELPDIATQFAPVAIKNAIKGMDMLNDGFYSDTRGRRVIDTTDADAFWKSIGFQPASVARSSKDAQSKQQSIARQKQKESAIAEMFARAQFEKDPSKADKARKMLIEWNEGNPDLPIMITPRQIIQRVRRMNMTREERQLKATPRELRGLL